MWNVVLLPCWAIQCMWPTMSWVPKNATYARMCLQRYYSFTKYECLGSEFRHNFKYFHLSWDGFPAEPACSAFVVEGSHHWHHLLVLLPLFEHQGIANRHFAFWEWRDMEWICMAHWLSTNLWVILICIIMWFHITTHATTGTNFPPPEGPEEEPQCCARFTSSYESAAVKQ